ncbi:MAG TPA: hypothetical protein DD811_12900 [Syntrophomonas sp.]|nr:hypothetical protein [Syntrophomonas sp.]
MFIQTHMLIGNHINNTINATLPVSIRRSGYLFGCTLPDLLPGYLAVPHVKEPSLHFVSTLMTETLQTIPRSPQELLYYSIELGIITHYVCDYFCQPHHNSTAGRAWDHARYENQLARKFKQTDLKHLTVPMVIPFESADPTRLLTEYLDFKYSSYLNHPPSTFLDICYSVQTSSTIVLSILNNLSLLASRAA